MTTLEELKLLIEKCKHAAIADDDEVAHRREDQLRWRALEMIAAGAEDSQGIAELALSTSAFKFSRWYA